MNNTNQFKKIDALTGMRFFMIMLVVFQHIGMPGVKWLWAGGTNYAMSWFFVLSGFGMMYKVLTENGSAAFPEKKNPLTLYRYAFRKVGKIYKWYILSLLIALPIRILHIFVSGGGAEAAKLMFMCLFAPTLLQSAIGKFEYASMLNGVTWFLSALFIIYMLFPLLYILERKVVRTKRGALIWVLGSGLIYLLLSYIAPVIEANTVFDTLAYASPFFRIFEFSAGCGLADFFVQSRAGNGDVKKSCKIGVKPSASIIEIFAICITMAFIYIMGYADGYSEVLNVAIDGMAVFIALILIGVFLKQKGMLSKLLGSKTMVFLGGLSMYLYIFHYVLWEGIQSLAKRLPVSERTNEIIIVTGSLVAVFILTFIAYSADHRRVIRKH